MKALLQDLMPPVAWRGLRAIAQKFKSPSSAPAPATVQPASWYDAVYQTSEEYRLHYTESCYYFLWTVIVDRLLRTQPGRILDLGCGPGQFAALLRDKGIAQYCGLDFSPTSIQQARQRCPSFQFEVADICNTPWLTKISYDTVIALEFLEHVEKETAVIQQLRPGARFIASVPNFPYVSHVRHFTSPQDVHDRYGSYFSDFRVDPFDEDPKGKRYYLMEGVLR